MVQFSEFFFFFFCENGTICCCRHPTRWSHIVPRAYISPHSYFWSPRPCGDVESCSNPTKNRKFVLKNKNVYILSAGYIIKRHRRYHVDVVVFSFKAKKKSYSIAAAMQGKNIRRTTQYLLHYSSCKILNYKYINTLFF